MSFLAPFEGVFYLGWFVFWVIGVWRSWEWITDQPKDWRRTAVLTLYVVILFGSVLHFGLRA